MIGTPPRSSAERQLQRRLAAVLDDDTFAGFLDGDDLQHVLERHRLEVEAIEVS